MMANEASLGLLHRQQTVALKALKTLRMHACGQRGCREGGCLFGDEAGRLLSSVCDRNVLTQRVNSCMALFPPPIHFNPSPVAAGTISDYCACNSKECLLLLYCLISCRIILTLSCSATIDLTGQRCLVLYGSNYGDSSPPPLLLWYEQQPRGQPS